MKRTFALAGVALLAACAAPRQEVIVGGPLTAQPQLPPNDTSATGGIFRAASYRPLFEDRKPRYVGDILTIQINEKLNASQSANSNTERKAEFEVGFPGVRGILGTNINPLSAKASAGNTFDGKGATTSSNLFTGTITVTVVEVLPNGNLRVAGEKQIGVRRNAEVLRFAGVVNPAHIQPGNVVSSTQVADARLDYRGSGYIEEAQIKGWLSRFFDSFSPF
ncbi:MAG: flagellar basal body L-ring protein FlgH [Sutterellaceae bacterium]|nr:flagellar basal body L-ring protein FlgH [Burkholderiaceae bacterium]MCX7902526.1 flagellar basal body L-ring protein FlgH [Burkholderiaceae bacterium]MDW8429978.1 flagellar basal body L-ring protein FlgH [Sutterellaceae bacterium]